MDIADKLAILTDAAKYDVSCASSSAPKRSSHGKDGLGATSGMGICHSFTPDGRCVALLKILLTNLCVYDCQYCVNRRSSNVPRARFTADEVVRLTLDFYRRNYIEGLFLSSGIIRSSDYTMEQLVAVARSLREQHGFRGYIHLKTIPDADPLLIEAAGRHADRLSVNIELPTEAGIARLAPEKQIFTIKRAMGTIRGGIEEAAEARRPKPKTPAPRARPPRFSPAGQSTQMIVGADDTDDRTILDTAETLYGSYRLKRVYYSAFSPIPDSPRSVPAAPAPLIREHRLYQADFLVRGYGFRVGELLPASGNLALDIDPKLGWALVHREHFPVDLNVAEEWLVARVPGIGVTNARRIMALRRQRAIRWDDLARLRCSMPRLKSFIVTADYRPQAAGQSSDRIRRALTRKQPAQLSLWGDLAPG
ncbi:putative DNA modification/repair radical SAM protein [Uliginosibacterium sp. H1]|uniref:putative DNA modification/repair radical SAM protein n=1 Tax=Uliginosibacterium sp. H1 TaxID=3114757 RepID=UPI002E171190|nr:putative DNA modification/repair radical SAM protein [Uliginosibacterium sp. H1]